MSDPYPEAAMRSVFALMLLCMLGAGAVAPPDEPLHFIPNRGEAGAAVRYVAERAGCRVLLADDEAVLAVDGARVRMRLDGANPRPRVTGREPLPVAVDLLAGAADTWFVDPSRFAEVHYEAVYPGVDLVYYGAAGRTLAFEFVLRPGADPAALRVRLEGARPLRLDPDGSLVVALEGRTFRQLPPAVYQVHEGRRVSVEGRYVLRGGVVSFALGVFDPARMLVVSAAFE